MITLKELIKNLKTLDIIGKETIKISSIYFDSRKVTLNSIFVVIRGTLDDGSKFIADAIDKGAKVIISDIKIKNKNTNITYITVKDSRLALSIIAQNFYGEPSKKLKLIGVTGTNGKTTTATLLFNLFRLLDYNVALISTVENKINDKIFPATQTTPDPISLTSFLSDAVTKKCKFAFMECSSHAIDQKRIAGLNFAGGIFTNLTQDHLDYHRTMDKYALAKKTFFDMLPKSSFALVNSDDKKSVYMLGNTKAKKYTYALKNLHPNFRGKIISDSLDGLTLSINKKNIHSKLIGTFNAYNLLSVFSTSKLLGIPDNKIIPNIEKLLPPAGRLEFIKSSSGIYGIVDYAHTPDALLNVLKTLKEIKQKKSKIITVVGCGGDRDKTKRPIMGKIASNLSNLVIFTSDNPRSEDPKKILRDMTKNLRKKSFICQPDRAKAITLACAKAKPNDIVIIVGKGHENYQVFKNQTIHFSDKEELEKNLK